MASSVWIARHDLPVFNKSCCQNKPLTTTQRRRRRERERGTTFIDGGLASHDFDDEHREGGMHPTRSLAGPGATDSTDRGIQRQSGAKRETKFISPVFVTSDRRRWAGEQGRVQRRDGDGPCAPQPRADSYLKSLSGGVAHGRGRRDCRCSVEEEEGEEDQK